MTRAAYVFIPVFVLVLAGCTDTSIAPPEDTAAGGTLIKAVSPKNVIRIQETFRTQAGQKFQFSGTIEYTVTHLPILREELYKAELKTTATVANLANSRAYDITSQQEHIVNLTANATASITELHFLRGGPSSLTLTLTYEVSAAGMTLIAASIE